MERCWTGRVLLPTLGKDFHEVWSTPVVCECRRGDFNFFEGSKLSGGYEDMFLSIDVLPSPSILFLICDRNVLEASLEGGS